MSLTITTLYSKKRYKEVVVLLQQESMFLGTYINAHTDREVLESKGGYLHREEEAMTEE